MKNKVARFTLFTLVAAALIVASGNSRAEDKPATNHAAPPVATRTPFHGQVSAMDTAAMTLTVGELTLHVTAETRIIKAGKPATLSEIAVGETVRGSYKKEDAGRLDAVNISVIQRSPGMEKKKKAAKTTPPETASKN